MTPNPASAVVITPDQFLKHWQGHRGLTRRVIDAFPDDKLFTYQVESFTWSPNAHVIAVQLFTTTMDPDAGAREDAHALLFLDDSGRERGRAPG